MYVNNNIHIEICNDWTFQILPQTLDVDVYALWIGWRIYTYVCMYLYIHTYICMYIYIFTPTDIWNNWTSQTLPRTLDMDSFTVDWRASSICIYINVDVCIFICLSTDIWKNWTFQIPQSLDMDTCTVDWTASWVHVYFIIYVYSYMYIWISTIIWEDWTFQIAQTLDTDSCLLQCALDGVMHICIFRYRYMYIYMYANRYLKELDISNTATDCRHGHAPWIGRRHVYMYIQI